MKSETAVFTYKVDNPYMPSHEWGVRYDDPQIGIAWGAAESDPVVTSEKDRLLPFLKEAEINFEELKHND